jgi:hypothetical protein
VGANTYNTTGIYTDILASFGGCDSTVTTNLTVTDSIMASQSITICAGTSITVGGMVYDTTGMYVNYFIAAGGCDSTLITNLIVTPSIMSTQTFTICYGDSIAIGGIMRDTAGVYTNVFTTMGGCDSTVTTTLTVLPQISDTTAISLCFGGSINIGGNIHNTSGTYIDVLTAQNGCDSTVVSQLTIIPLPTVNLPAYTSYICLQDPTFALFGGTPSGGVYTGSAVSSGNLNPALAGTGMDVITYTITDAITLCTNSDTSSIAIHNCTGIDEYSLANSISVYPNPTSGQFSISVNGNYSELLINIVDVEGREVYSSVDKNIVTGFSKQINLETLAKGIYYIKMNSGAESNVQKLVVQ